MEEIMFEKNPFEKLFTQFNQLEGNYHQEWLNELKTSVTALTMELSQKKGHWNELLKKETPYYNIFDILNIRHYETKVHTPFLRHLLDPTASHEHNYLFAEAFIQNVVGWPFHFSEITRYQIHEELSTDEGRIDLIIRFNYKNERNAIVIENKIYATDQYKQLERYYRYITEIDRIRDNNIKLVYLTLNGHFPSEDSINNQLAIQLSDKGVLITKSYRTDIKDWLTSCLRNVNSPRVENTIQQYIKTIQSL